MKSGRHLTGEVGALALQGHPRIDLADEVRADRLQIHPLEHAGKGRARRGLVAVEVESSAAEGQAEPRRAVLAGEA